MKKLAGAAILLMVLASMVCGIVAAAESVGPAPSSGDGVSDGSGFDQPNYQNAETPGMGPAPNSSDGTPDGSGFE